VISAWFGLAGAAADFAAGWGAAESAPAPSSANNKYLIMNKRPALILHPRIAGRKGEPGRTAAHFAGWREGLTKCQRTEHLGNVTNGRQRFLEDYRRIRYAEGRGSEDPAYYQALPFRDLSGRNPAMWKMRARTFRYFEQHILAPLETAAQKPLDILDLGAGNGWLSYRMSLRGHRVFAADIFLDERDGLAATRHYGNRFAVVGAEFDQLPFPASRFDLLIFNASLHYSTDYQITLAEARRCLRPEGDLVILDSPVYRKRVHGEKMAAERHEEFQKRYGIRSDAIPSIEFLDEPGLADLSRSLNVQWTVYRPWYGFRWHLRPLQAWFKRRRPPSRFWILVGRFRHTSSQEDRSRIPEGG